MQAIQIRQTAPATAGSFSEALVNDFIAYIDRGAKTTSTYLTNLRQFMAWLKYAGIAQPIRADIIAYRDYLLSEHEAIELAPEKPCGWQYRLDKTGSRYTITCRPGTAAQYLRNVCQLFRWTAANNLYPDIAENIHAPKIRHDQHKKDALTPAEVQAIKEDIQSGATTEQGKRLYAMFLLAVTAGLRTIELSRASIKDLQVKSGTACLYVWGKGHSEPDAKKPLAPEVYAAIKDYLNSRTDRPTAASPLFVATGNRSGGKRIEARTISQMLKRAFRAAGFDSERITAHSLRHTAGTAAMQLTGDLYATQKYMRHSNPATTEIYLHIDTEQQETALAQQLYDLFTGKKTEDGRDRLQDLINSLSAAQIEQLSGIAAAMAK